MFWAFFFFLHTFILTVSIIYKDYDKSAKRTRAAASLSQRCGVAFRIKTANGEVWLCRELSPALRALSSVLCVTSAISPPPQRHCPNQISLFVPISHHLKWYWWMKRSQLPKFKLFFFRRVCVSARFWDTRRLSAPSLPPLWAPPPHPPLRQDAPCHLSSWLQAADAIFWLFWCRPAE